MEELTLFEESLAEYIKEWQESGKNPLESLEELKEDATELYGVVLDDVPCWNKANVELSNGLYQTPNGMALVHNGLFVMLDDLVERLPRIAEHD